MTDHAHRRFGGVPIPTAHHIIHQALRTSTNTPNLSPGITCIAYGTHINPDMLHPFLYPSWHSHISLRPLHSHECCSAFILIERAHSTTLNRAQCVASSDAQPQSLITVDVTSRLYGRVHPNAHGNLFLPHHDDSVLHVNLCPSRWLMPLPVISVHRSTDNPSRIQPPSSVWSYQHRHPMAMPTGVYPCTLSP
jgi:hypothetical protein